MLGRRPPASHGAARTSAAGATLGALLLLTACTAAVDSGRSDGVGGTPAASGSPATGPTGATATATTTTPTPTTTTTTTTTAPTTTSTSSTSTTTTSTTTTSTTTTTTTTLPPGIYDPECVVQVAPGEGLLEIVDRFDDDTVDAETVRDENGLETDVLEPGQLLDVCVGNGLDDIDGSTRTERNDALVGREVRRQQEHLNSLFAPYGIRDLTVDGISGPVTRQRLCAFRLAAGLPVTLTDMQAGSDEEQVLFDTDALPTPFDPVILTHRWALIDQTCQIMFVGTGARLQFVFPTSTGLAEFPTRDQDRSTAFKYDPAADNAGWHNSLTYPAAEDNPLNGNMYRPLYFDGGQAIHGANNVPRAPASHGCARLRVDDMDALIGWLGLGDRTSVTYDEGEIDLVVTVTGRYPG